jgi:hypothetical protein
VESGPVIRYIPVMSAKPDPIVSEFDSPEEEAAYNEWFRKKVEASLADPRPVVPHDQVMAELDAILKARRKKC